MILDCEVVSLLEAIAGLEDLLVLGRSALRGVLVLFIDCAPGLGLGVVGLEVVHLICNFMDATEDQDVAVFVKSDLVATLVHRLLIASQGFRAFQRTIRG